MGKLRSYRVSWVIELDAESPVEAAALALEIQRDPESIATVFEVQEVAGPSGQVDLCLDRPLFCLCRSVREVTLL